MAAERLRARAAVEPGHRPAPEMLLEEPDGLGDRLELAARLGLECEGYRDAAALAQVVQRGDVRNETVGDRIDVAWRGDPLLVRPRYGRDAALATGRQKIGEDARQLVRVGEARVLAPVRTVDRLLHRRAVERAVGKAVDREHVETALGEESMKGGELVRLRERRRGCA